MSEPKKPSSKRPARDQFGDLVNSMNDFFREKPVKGILESIDEFFSAPFPSNQHSFSAELHETENEITITSKLPGIKKEQIFIDIFPHYVTISVQNNELITQEDQNHDAIFRKQTFQRNTRTIQLPSIVNDKKAKASYQDGLLVIQIPKEKGKRLQIES
ncbi:Hsp20/alpha crystallin family protein [Falsibacillus albus]|uniref:Hsp20/alpha crystallin family protein n=1 Tax=Falsibacillus albus TaxID=2478915 RepID=A0A3L7JZN0_9BACI|nr:Hsp20/alpha crystallin family protein [Falsibacillus albus]RLQ95141.1 Hsp20/alpha crystallin family protein [Falsibacillus albus]